MTSQTEFLEASADDRPKVEIVGGRYKLPDRDRPGKYKLHTRVTNVAKALDDEGGLRVWESGKVAEGIALRPDLAVEMLAATEYEQRKKVVEDAKEIAGGNISSRHGTAMHTITERIDRGEKFPLSPAVRADVDAYRRAMSCFEVTTIERLVVLHELGVAGRLDRLVRVAAHPEWGECVLDIKTGEIERKFVSILAQVTLYARAKEWFDIEAGVYRPVDPPVNQDIAFVLHLPQGEATATIWQLDLSLGDEIVFQCLEVRRLRNLKGIARQVKPADLAGPAPPPAVPAPEPLAPVSSPVDRGGGTTAATASGASSTVPGAVAPNLTLVQDHGAVLWPAQGPYDNGVAAAPKDIAQLKTLVASLPPEQRQRLSDWEREALRAKRSFGATHDMTQRMFACARAALAMSMHVEGWQERIALAAALNAISIPGDWLIGACIGSLTTGQADELTRLALTARDTGALDPF